MGGVGLQDKYHVDTVQLDQVIPDNELPVIADAGIINEYLAKKKAPSNFYLVAVLVSS